MDRRRRRPRVLAAAALAAATLGAAPALAGAAVSTGHSGWAWASPSPQGEDIADLSFAGSTGYAVGGFGTLLRSTDAGQTWTGLASRTDLGLARVIARPGGGFVAAGGCAVRRAGADGAALPIDVGGGDRGCGAFVLAVSFPDAQNGMLLFNNGVVLATADGGASLSRRTPVPAPLPTDLAALSPTVAFATSGDSIYRTQDGGNSWTRVGQSPPVLPPFNIRRPLRAIGFVSPAVGYAVGDGGTVLKSVDGGATWQPAANAGPDLTRVTCATESLCLFATTAGTSLVRTTDGGATYSQVTVAGVPIRAIAFASPTRAIAAGTGGVTVISDDGGATWRGIGTSIGADLASVAVRGGGFAYGVGPNAIALTRDDGETWTRTGIPTPLGIRVASFADPLTGYAQDSGGTLWRTLNGGASWQVLDPGTAQGLLQDIVALGSGRVLLATARGVARSTNGGRSFALLRSPAIARSRAVRSGLVGSSASGSIAFLIGKRGIVRATRGGGAWQALILPRVARRTPKIAAGDCAAPSTCWIVTTGSRMFRTINLGRRWTEVTPGVGVPLRSIARVAAGAPGEAFLALRPGALPTALGVVLHTTDGGRTWAPQPVQSQPIASIDAAGSRALALAGTNRVLTTATGGRVGRRSTLTIRASRRVITRRTGVAITGRLSGATGGERVTLYARGFPARTVTVASSGTFTSPYRLTRTTTFVAQWAGDGLRDGDGTPVLTVRRRAR